MACHALGIATRELLRADHSVCLWLVPSNTIREQTIKALKDRRHPYRQVIDSTFAGNVEVMDLTEALYVSKGDLDGATCIIVTTLQALRVEDTDGRKVYESDGALQHHFADVPSNLRATLESEGNGTITYSLANVFRLRRPVVIVDEAHNARTTLSFDTLARFQPACVVEFTATPQTDHQPERGLYASNVLYQVSAKELKEAEMIKLPIKLRTHDDWRETVALALQTQRSLEVAAATEQKQTGEYIRPIVLFQAQSVTGEDINVEKLKQVLITDFKVPADQIAIATGVTREIKDVDLFNLNCPIRHIITVKALVEGWDCSFAYILCSISNISTSRSVEQILGRILRLPHAHRKQQETLNCAYAFAASQNFIHTAQSLKDALIEGAGFQRLEADDLVVPDVSVQSSLWPDGTLFAAASEVVSETPDLSPLAPRLRALVSFDSNSKTLSVSGGLSEDEERTVAECFRNHTDKQIVKRLCTRARSQALVSGSSLSRTMSVPLLAIRVNGQLEIFEESHFIDYDWQLVECDPAFSESEFSATVAGGAAGQIDVDDTGHIATSQFAVALHNQLQLIAGEPGWTKAQLVSWLDRSFLHPDIPQIQTQVFIGRVLDQLIESKRLELAQVTRHKFRLGKAIEKKIGTLRNKQRQEAYQQTLFGSDRSQIEVSSEVSCVLDFDRYSPNWYYQGAHQFQKHLFRAIGELGETGEEFECALFLDLLPQVETWVRNIERRADSSFWLQTSTDKFYPDFVCQLTDGRILVVEHKGEHLYSNDDSKEKRLLGDLWADKSGGKCLFVMTRGRDFNCINNSIKG
jgi:type III restriction enzyme